MFLILTLIILVAAFNVISGLIMMVKDKTRDIAVLRTLGGGRGAVMRIFLMAGASVGVMGTSSGLLLACVFCRNIEEHPEFLQISPARICSIRRSITSSSCRPCSTGARWCGWSVMALALSLLATLYPSWRAARTDPVEALRHE